MFREIKQMQKQTQVESQIKNQAVALKEKNTAQKCGKLKIKLLALGLLVVAILGLFSGCASINYLEKANSDGTYLISFSVEIDTNNLKGLPLNSVHNDILNVLNLKTLDFNSRYAMNLEKCFNSKEISGRNFLDLQSAFLAELAYEEYYSPIYYLNILISPTESEGKIFSVNDVITIFNRGTLVPSPDSGEDDSSELKTNFLTIILEETLESPYSSEDVEAYADYFLNEKNYAGAGFTLNDADFSYTRAVAFRRVHSNADQINKYGGEYYHTWNFEQDENGQPIAGEMKIYRTFLNTINWYWVGLGVAVLIVGGVTLILFVNRKKTPKNDLPSNKINEDNLHF